MTGPKILEDSHSASPTPTQKLAREFVMLSGRESSATRANELFETGPRKPNRSGLFKFDARKTKTNGNREIIIHEEKKMETEKLIHPKTATYQASKPVFGTVNFAPQFTFKPPTPLSVEPSGAMQRPLNADTSSAYDGSKDESRLGPSDFSFFTPLQPKPRSNGTSTLGAPPSLNLEPSDNKQRAPTQDGKMFSFSKAPPTGSPTASNLFKPPHVEPSNRGLPQPQRATPFSFGNWRTSQLLTAAPPRRGGEEAVFTGLSDQNAPFARSLLHDQKGPPPYKRPSCEQKQHANPIAAGTSGTEPLSVIFTKGSGTPSPVQPDLLGRPAKNERAKSMTAIAPETPSLQPPNTSQLLCPPPPASTRRKSTSSIVSRLPQPAVEKDSPNSADQNNTFITHHSSPEARPSTPSTKSFCRTTVSENDEDPNESEDGSHVLGTSPPGDSDTDSEDVSRVLTLRKASPGNDDEPVCTKM
jgi:hypothetical protein